MLQTLERTQTFDARVLNADHAAALRALTGPSGLPLLPCLLACGRPGTARTGRALC